MSAAPDPADAGRVGHGHVAGHVSGHVSPGRASQPAVASSVAWRLERVEHGRLDFFDPAGRRHADVDVLRAFPITAPDGPVSIVAADGDELAWIDPLSALAEPLQSLIARELGQREFLPVIERIESVTDGEPTEWSVVTDRGPRRFTVAHTDDIAYAPDGGASIVDVAGVRYRIPNVARLDARSRRLLVRLD